MESLMQHFDKEGRLIQVKPNFFQVYCAHLTVFLVIRLDLIEGTINKMAFVPFDCRITKEIRSLQLPLLLKKKSVQ